MVSLTSRGGAIPRIYDSAGTEMVHENIVIESERKEGCAKYKLVNGVFLVETLSRSSVAGLEKIRLQVSWLNTEGCSLMSLNLWMVT